jgi:hypothetical protein
MKRRIAPLLGMMRGQPRQWGYFTAVHLHHGGGMLF